MNQTAEKIDVRVEESIKRFGLEKIFGSQSIEKLNYILNKENMWNILLEEWTERMRYMINGTYLEKHSKYEKKEIEKRIMDDIIKNIMQRALYLAIKNYKKQITDDILEKVMDKKIILDTMNKSIMEMQLEIIKSTSYIVTNF